MSSYKAPSFQDRIAAAGSAKKRALDALKSKPPVDEALMEERRKAREAKEQALAHFHNSYLPAILREHQGNITHAARASGLDRQALQRLLRRYGVQSSTFR